MSRKQWTCHLDDGFCDSIGALLDGNRHDSVPVSRLAAVKLQLSLRRAAAWKLTRGRHLFAATSRKMTMSRTPSVALVCLEARPKQLHQSSGLAV